MNSDQNDFAPRLGVSWSPDTKTVIRVGSGVFYSQDSGNPRFDMARNLAGRTRFNSDPKIPNLNWQNSFLELAGSIPQISRPYTFANAFDRRTPYSIQFLLNVQRDLGNQSSFEIGYLGNVSHRLESMRAVNEALPACSTANAGPGCENDPLAGLPNHLRSPFPNFGRIQLVDNGGSGNYHSLGAKLTKRYSGGLTSLVSYTWSKSIDNASAIRNQGGDTLFPQNSYCRSCERALSSHNADHRLVTSLLYDLPVGNGRALNVENSVLNALVGNWQLGSIFTLQSGFPITVTDGSNHSGVGGVFDRPDATGQDPNLPRGQQDPVRFFNTGAYQKQVIGQFGNVGRNTLTGPGIISWDFSMLKDFNFDETRRLQFRFEAFNFPNHPNWNNPTTDFRSGNFGRLTSTRTNMRQLQFAVKFYF